MRITEIFYSLQGEGRLAGVPTVFVRTTGCHLRCSWCDTAYSFYGGEELSIDEILDEVDQHPTDNVCFTGGEPLIQKQAPELVQRLLDDDCDVVIETSGSLDLSDYRDMQPREQLTLSVDVKCPSSDMEDENRLDELERLTEHDQVKFVIGSEEDYEYAKEVMDEVHTSAPFIVQPVWGSNETWLAETMLEDGIDARYSLQTHKILWGDKPGV
jgi:7-carboxy-7-deazaguanine synthase